ncbi:hypothetical protein [Adlercreutzia sp. ZJ154]|uniref:hypothetical protein n=1 Tax=Adlercreutzia sp. ZJ154 TaxID=2709790 RepID=UPI0013ED040E|nr:hypothetical protein [Adlercreutzia sp. ZJ154]
MYTRTSKASPGMKECPGWCDALEAYDRQRKAQKAAVFSSPELKTEKLARDERVALRALEAERVNTKGMLVLALLSDKCAKGGCASKGDTDAICPGWCTIARQAWNAWWSR